MQFIFTNNAKHDFLQLEKTQQQRIRKKIAKIKDGGGTAIKPLINMSPYTHRLRIENIRLLLRICEEGYEVLKIGHRSNIYK